MGIYQYDSLGGVLWPSYCLLRVSYISIMDILQWNKNNMFEYACVYSFTYLPTLIILWIQKLVSSG